MNSKAMGVCAAFGLALFLVAYACVGGVRAETHAGFSSAVTGEVRAIAGMNCAEPRVVTGAVRFVARCINIPIGNQQGVRIGLPIPNLPPIDCNAPGASCLDLLDPEDGAEQK